MWLPLPSARRQPVPKVAIVHLPQGSSRRLIRSPSGRSVSLPRDERRFTMSEKTTRVQRLRDRLAKRRSERRAASGERSVRRNEAKARRLAHERLDNKLPR
jgi:hypothetical protein